MRRTLQTFLLLLAIGLISPVAEAQSADSNWARITATVAGVFDFKIDGADYPLATAPALHDFGAISHTGVNGGVKVGGKTYYTANGAFNWTVVSAPRRTVDIVLRNPSKPTEPVAGPMALDQLAIEMTITNQAAGGAGTSLGMIPVAADELLVDDVFAGNGTSEANGAINLEIHVDGNDKAGDNVWLFELEATGI